MRAVKSKIKRAFYRVRQGICYVAERPTPEDEALAAALLPPPLLALYARMAPRDQAHAARVCRALRQKGVDDPILLQAALLHDVGKTGGIPLLYRVLYVLVGRWAPWLLQRLEQRSRVPALLCPLVQLARHPEIGAELAARAGASPDVVALIRWHQDGRGAPEHLREALHLLQSVDDAL